MVTSASALAVDHGTKRTGFAVADPLRISIEPLAPFHGPGNGEGILEHIESLVDERIVDVVVVGVPLNADGSRGGRVADVDAFCTKLHRCMPRLTIVKVDEHLTSKEADARLVEAGHTGQSRKDRRDSWSAAVILEDWIRAGEPRP